MPNRENEREQDRWRDERWRGSFGREQQGTRSWEDRDDDMRYGRGGGYGEREDYGRYGRGYNEDVGYGRYGGGMGGGYGPRMNEEYGRYGMGKPRDMSETWRRWGGGSGYGEERYGGYDRDRDREYGRYERDERSFGERVKDFFGFGDRSRRQHGRAPKGYVRSDERIREDVCDRLMAMPYIDASQVEIHVKDGEVTLEGMVFRRDEKRYIEDIAEEVLGVKDVNNRIRVSRQEEQQPMGTTTTRPRA